MSTTEPRPDPIMPPPAAVPVLGHAPGLPDANAVLLGLVASLATALVAAAIFVAVVVEAPRPHHGATHSAQLELEQRQAMIQQAEAAPTATPAGTPSPAEARP